MYTHDEEARYQGRRVENLGVNVEEWCERTGNAVSHKDLCLDCASKLDHNPHAFDGILLADCGDPQGEAGWGGDNEHPNYDNDEYRCANCKCLLAGW